MRRVASERASASLPPNGLGGGQEYCLGARRREHGSLILPPLPLPRRTVSPSPASRLFSGTSVGWSRAFRACRPVPWRCSLVTTRLCRLTLLALLFAAHRRGAPRPSPASSGIRLASTALAAVATSRPRRARKPARSFCAKASASSSGPRPSHTRMALGRLTFRVAVDCQNLDCLARDLIAQGPFAPSIFPPPALGGPPPRHQTGLVAYCGASESGRRPRRRRLSGSSSSPHRMAAPLFCPPRVVSSSFPSLSALVAMLRARLVARCVGIPLKSCR